MKALALVDFLAIIGLALTMLKPHNNSAWKLLRVLLLAIFLVVTTTVIVFLLLSKDTFSVRS